jgi:hypothetical protein
VAASDDRRHDGRHDRPADLKRGVDEARRQALLLVGDAGGRLDVQRAMCDLDRRGIDAMLTDEGRERYEQALPTQREVLARTLDA